MAHLWVPLVAGGHAVLPLESAEHALPAGPWPFSSSGAPSAATLVRVDARDTWALVVDRDERLRVNGVVVPAGLAVLADRDEIQLPGSPPLWFSTETVARIEQAPSFDGRALCCPRCRRLIEAGSPAVRCPGCRVWYHETSELPCFTYESSPCSSCGNRFELDGDFRWSPEEL